MNGHLSKNSNWKGENAKYQAFHIFVKRHFGKPNFCEMCKTTENRVYHWAAKNHAKGGRERKDWLRLCIPCHWKYDGKIGKHLSEETKRKIGAKNSINSLGNSSAKGHKLSDEQKKLISKKTKLGMMKKKLLLK
jgi:hypothetical protein